MRTLFGLIAVLAAGCDFTPTLDIETPAYQAGVVVRSMLVADSVATVWVDESWDPYQGRPRDRSSAYPPSPAGLFSAEVTLLRDGAVVERLTERRDRCVDESQPPVPEGGEVETFPCGPYQGTVTVEAGAAYTVRAVAEGRPPAEGTVTVPRRPGLEVEELARAGGDRQIRIRLADPAGAGDRYGLTLYSFRTSFPGGVCDNNGCRDTTYVIDNPDFYPLAFDTSDPVVLAASREIAGSGISFASFPDDTFEGQTKAFTIKPSSRYRSEDTDQALRVQVAALSADLYDLYQIEQFGGGEDNPFAEPINRPSNVVGGYGIVGALALAEVLLPPADASAARRR